MEQGTEIRMILKTTSGMTAVARTRCLAPLSRAYLLEMLSRDYWVPTQAEAEEMNRIAVSKGAPSQMSSTAIRRAMQELQQQGYVVRRKVIGRGAQAPCRYGMRLATFVTVIPGVHHCDPQAIDPDRLIQAMRDARQSDPDALALDAYRKAQQDRWAEAKQRSDARKQQLWDEVCAEFGGSTEEANDAYNDRVGWLVD